MLELVAPPLHISSAAVNRPRSDSSSNCTCSTFTGPFEFRKVQSTALIFIYGIEEDAPLLVELGRHAASLVIFVEVPFQIQDDRS